MGKQVKILTLALDGKFGNRKSFEKHGGVNFSSSEQLVYPVSQLEIAIQGVDKGKFQGMHMQADDQKQANYSSCLADDIG